MLAELAVRLVLEVQVAPFRLTRTATQATLRQAAQAMMGAAHQFLAIRHLEGREVLQVKQAVALGAVLRTDTQLPEAQAIVTAAVEVAGDLVGLVG